MTQIVNSAYIGPLRMRVLARGANFYTTSRHDCMPDLIGLRYLGQNGDHAQRKFDRAVEGMQAEIAADEWSRTQEG